MYADLEQSKLKRCGTCKQFKLLAAFNKDGRAKDGFCYRCNVCRKAYRMLIKHNIAQYNKQYARANPEKMQEKDRRNSLKRFWNMTLEEYSVMLDKQGGKCAICGQTSKNVSQRYKNLCIDHDHATGKIRGLLCDKCNRGLGLLNDSKILLKRALEYLDKF